MKTVRYTVPDNGVLCRYNTKYLNCVHGISDIINKMGALRLDSVKSKDGPVAGSCRHGNDCSGSIKSRAFLDYIHH